MGPKKSGTGNRRQPSRRSRPSSLVDPANLEGAEGTVAAPMEMEDELCVDGAPEYDVATATGAQDGAARAAPCEAGEAEARHANGLDAAKKRKRAGRQKKVVHIETPGDSAAVEDAGTAVESDAAPGPEDADAAGEAEGPAPAIADDDNADVKTENTEQTERSDEPAKRTTRGAQRRAVQRKRNAKAPMQLQDVSVDKSDQLLKQVMTELTELQATFGVRYNLTLIGPHGELKVISSPAVQTITMDPTEIAELPYPKKLNILSNAAEIKLQEVHDSEGYGLWPWEKKQPDTPQQSDGDDDVRTEDVMEEAREQIIRKPIKFTGGDGDEDIDYADSATHAVTPGLMAVVEFVSDTAETPYLGGSFWRRDPFPSASIIKSAERMVVAPSGGQAMDMKRINRFLDIGAIKDSDALSVMDEEPSPCDASDLFIVPVWGIDSYTRALLDLALASCEGGILSRTKRNAFFDSYFFPQLNKLQHEGWDALKALQMIAEDDTAPDEIRAAAGGTHKLLDVLEETAGTGVPVQRYQPLRPSGRKYTRGHPKGDGVVLRKEGGLASGAFVGHYGGNVCMPWRFYESEVSKLSRGNSKSQCILPTHSVTLERPNVDDMGSFILFVDASQTGNFASRINHRCEPNCVLKTFVVNGKMQLGVWALRDVRDGEELTIDFRNKGDFERELQGLACLCGSEHCAKSFVNTQVPTSPINSFMMEKYNILQRTKMLLESVNESGLTRNDTSRLERYGFKKMLLEDALDVDNTYPVPKWLTAWAAQTLRIIEEESEELRNNLQTTHLDPEELGYRLEDVDRLALCRVKLLMAAMDKARFFLNNQDYENSKAPPIQLLGSAGIADHLWNGATSIAKRAIKAIEGYMEELAAVSVGAKRSSRQKDLAKAKAAQPPWWQPAGASIAEGDADEEAIDVDKVEYLTVEEVYERMKELASTEKPKTAQAAQAALRALADVAAEGGPVHAGIHDLLLMYSYTNSYFSQTDFKAFKSVLADGKVSGTRYRPPFLWALLSGWYKFVGGGDVVEALGVDRKGVLCLPDVECTYQAAFTNGEYFMSDERKNLIKFFGGDVASVWPRNLPSFTFKTASQFFGTPQLDAVLGDGDDRSLEALTQHLGSSFVEVSMALDDATAS